MHSRRICKCFFGWDWSWWFISPNELHDLNDSQHLKLYRAPQQNLKCCIIDSPYITILQKKGERAVYQTLSILFPKKTPQKFNFIFIGFYLNNFKDLWMKKRVIHQAGETEVSFLYFLWTAKYCNQVVFPPMPVPRFSKLSHVRTDILFSPFLFLVFLQNCHNFVSSGEMVLMSFWKIYLSRLWEQCEVVLLLKQMSGMSPPSAGGH